MKLSQFGPGALVAAAFIGPGTVITASLAGANYGYALLWALLFSVVACLILQEMALRIGIVTQQGLGENIRANLTNPLTRAFFIALVFAAVVIGNSVYQGGNLSGASMGLAGLFGELTWPAIGLTSGWPIIVGGTAFAVLWTGNARFIEKALIGLVLLMSLSFIGTFFLTQPDLSRFFSGLLLPSLPTGATLTVVALIGTTVVPYNLFLHASSVAKKWRSPAQLKQAQADNLVSIPLGGLISMAVLATAASAFFGSQQSITSAADLATSLEPLFGVWAQYLMAIGLFAAGISSASTAPLASAYALSGIMGWSKNLKSRSFRLTWLAILVIGVFISSLGLEPISVIWLAQVANGVLLPVMVGFIWWLCNKPSLGHYKNRFWQNLLAGLVMLISLGLSAKSLINAFA
ncbi:MAG: manganese transporter [Idiomarina sp.]|uniref:Nramp family divalent metal transporter n=1 Tax=Idiomarina sp. TaxID=1874361 RepID=UPI000C0DBEB9|nr:Nramp family divalent metal transporter [Idiomarina sp.]MBL4742032.1 Nramp family divalent metal transporter [Idiomarina sp.]MBT41061.1 manganese transporter [Idiomarina sp.]PHQ77349.1 MAG: manganese transporter [Idiomarina sp.]